MTVISLRSGKHLHVTDILHFGRGVDQWELSTVKLKLYRLFLMKLSFPVFLTMCYIDEYWYVNSDCIYSTPKTIRNWISIPHSVVTSLNGGVFVTNYKLCVFIFRCRAMRASRHAVYTCIRSQLMGWVQLSTRWAQYATLWSATMPGM